ncbi:MAG: alanine racemase [Elusimicrobiota bacterium]|jgi:alanine racemase|nr:alanine racemase [Elusimicrobiota bacterium]
MTMKDIPVLRPTVAQIDLTALRFNLDKARFIAQSRGGRRPKILFTVKANAYGHGMLPAAQYAQKADLCDAFGVTSIEEGIILRHGGITKPVLVLGSVYPFEYFEYAVKNNLAVTIASARAANYIKDLAAKLKMNVSCHIKLETGMNRIGSRRPAALGMLEILNGAPYIKVGGCYSHLSCAEDVAFAARQAEYFKEFLAAASALGMRTGMAHIAASGGFMKYKDLGFDMVRLGRLAYGLEEGFKPVMTLKSGVVFIKDIRAGAGVGYGKAFVAGRPSRIATIPIGYGDGYPRALGNKAFALVAGRRVPVIGNVAMDMIMADITDLGDIPVGSEVVLIGEQGGARISATEVAAWAGTVDYEIVTAVSARVPRIISAQ